MKLFLSAVLLAGIFLMAVSVKNVADPPAESGAVNHPPAELGAVNWGRDLDAAKKHSAETGKPVFVLFQEVPG